MTTLAILISQLHQKIMLSKNHVHYAIRSIGCSVQFNLTVSLAVCSTTGGEKDVEVIQANGGVVKMLHTRFARN